MEPPEGEVGRREDRGKHRHKFSVSMHRRSKEVHTHLQTYKRKTKQRAFTDMRPSSWQTSWGLGEAVCSICSHYSPLSTCPPSGHKLCHVLCVQAMCATCVAAPLLQKTPRPLPGLQAHTSVFWVELWVVSLLYGVNGSRNVMNTLLYFCIMEITLWAVSALLRVRACFNHSREGLIGTRSRSATCGSALSSKAHSKIFRLILFVITIINFFLLLCSFPLIPLSKEMLCQIRKTFEGLCLLHPYCRAPMRCWSYTSWTVYKSGVDGWQLHLTGKFCCWW